jgi:hypothetical protein
LKSQDAVGDTTERGKTIFVRKAIQALSSVEQSSDSHELDYPAVPTGFSLKSKGNQAGKRGGNLEIVEGLVV